MIHEPWKIAYYLHPNRSIPVTVSYREIRQSEITTYRKEEDINYTYVRFPPLDNEPGRFEWIRKSHLLPDIEKAQEYLDFAEETRRALQKRRNELVTLEGTGF